jgi:hypothetical protein
MAYPNLCGGGYVGAERRSHNNLGGSAHGCTQYLSLGRRAAPRVLRQPYTAQKSSPLALDVVVKLRAICVISASSCVDRFDAGSSLDEFISLTDENERWLAEDCFGTKNRFFAMFLTFDQLLPAACKSNIVRGLNSARRFPVLLRDEEQPPHNERMVFGAIDGLLHLAACA